MINAVERLGDRLLSLVAPRAEAAASCTIATRWVYCGWCLYDPSCGSSYAPSYYHEERLIAECGRAVIAVSARVRSRGTRPRTA
jgi:hypothetical protein